MTNQEAIKYLRQLYPYGGHCWLDKQRTEAIGMAIQALQEEPVSEDLKEAIDTYLATYFGGDKEKQEWPFLKKMAIYFAEWQKKRDYIPLSDDINEVARQICNKVLNCEIDYKEDDVILSDEEECVKAGIRWQMQKESIVSDDLEEAMQHNAPNNIGIDDLLYWRNGFIAGAKYGKNQAKVKIQAQSMALAHGCPEESVTKDLGDYINELSKQFPEVSFAKLSRIAVRVAKWQEKKDQSTIELAEDHAMLAGMEKMKEEMMAKAIDAKVLENYDGKVLEYDDSILDEKLSDCKVFDKVKIIVIKEKTEL